ncbi:MAG: RluA family pseudouridine synthase [Candidatus Dependentiae bacterium]|nr:RluA family pseudouridine synthase [Candidatus Dependentiae bacterium]
MSAKKNTDLIPTGTTMTICVAPDEPIGRIDQFISQQFPLYSRSFFKRLIDKNCIFINTILVKKSGALIKPHDTITLLLPASPSIDEHAIMQHNPDITMIYKHEHFLIVYKPAGLTVHKPHAQSTEITLVEWLLVHHQEIAHVGSIDRPGIVHRLDKNTSGMLIISRTNHAHAIFTALFKEHAITKIYLALVKGHPDKTGTIDLAIGRHPVVKTKMIAINPTDPRAHSINKLRSACTHYEVISYFETYSLVKVTLITGRTHQIRAHFSAIGHPLIGDSVYGEASHLINRQALHAHVLSFVFDGTPFIFTSPLPADMQAIIDKN